MATHLLVSEIAIGFFPEDPKAANHVNHIVNFIRKHRQYMHAGSMFPDWGYMCSSNDASEDSHWPLFWNASIIYFQQTYQSEILLRNGSLDFSLLSEKGQQLVAFLFGVYSHGVSDINWHSLGFDEGFIRAMAVADFDGQFGAAHTYADALSDLSVSRFTTMSYLHAFPLPATDIIKIYNLRGFTYITEKQLYQCIFLGNQITKANKALGKYLFPVLAPRTPFFTKEFLHYHKGGVINMAVNVADCWLVAFDWFVTGVMTPCPHLADAFTRQSVSQHSLPFKNISSTPRNGKKEGSFYSAVENCLSKWSSSLQSTVFVPRYCAIKSIIFHSSIRTHINSSYFRFKAKLHSLYALLSQSFKSIMIASSEYFYPTCTNIKSIPSITISAKSLRGPTMFASSVVSGSMSPSKNRFLAISAPGYSSSSYGFLEGAIFIVPWSNLIFLQDRRIEFDISNVSSQTLTIPCLEPPPEKCTKFHPGARFGTALLVLDFNLDGIDDLIISAPFYGTEKDTLDGRLFVYYGLENGGFANSPNILISGEIFNRMNTGNNDPRGLVFGEKLAKADLDGDGHDDVFVLSPKATPDWGQSQYGQVHIFLASKRLDKSHEYLTSNDADFIFTGSFEYSLFGNSVAVSRFGSFSVLVIGAPGYSENDMQTSGAIHVYIIDINRKSTVYDYVIAGRADKGRFGSSLVFLESSNSSLSLMICSSSETSNSSIPRLTNLPGIFMSPIDSGYQSGVCRKVDLFFKFPKLHSDQSSSISGTSSLSWLGYSLLKTQQSFIYIAEPTVEAERGRVYKLFPSDFSSQKTGDNGHSIYRIHHGCWSGLNHHDRFGSMLAYDEVLETLFIGSLHTKERDSELFMSGSLTIIPSQ